jgi:lysophospholipase L1-like esterase
VAQREETAMKFRTELTVHPILDQISYHDKILMLGSCFTENIGTKLSMLLFDIHINPFGVIYNPVSIKNSIIALLIKTRYTISDLRFHNGLWYSFDHYTKFSGTSSDEVLDLINKTFLEARMHLKESRFLLLTFGTSFLYRHLETDRIVSNCHKIPASEFSRFTLTVDDIVQNYAEVIEKLQAVNPGIRLIFTVSPVRHLKDGFTENQRSKSTLLLAIGELIRQFPSFCYYFPAYEIMMDDLRDYRYYSSDLLHPNEQAIQYLWEMFCRFAIDEETQSIAYQVEDVTRSLAHKPMHTDTESYKRFTEKLQGNIRKLKVTFPFLKWQNLS